MDKREFIGTAKYISYGKIDARKRLVDLIPLRSPLSLIIDPCNECNFKCVFCPTADKELLRKVNRPQGKMDYKLFCKIIDDIGAFDDRIKLYLDKDGEPFLNKSLLKMIRYAKKQPQVKSVEIATNASLIGGMIDEIIKSGLDGVRVSVEHVTNAGYKMVTKTFDDYDKIKDNVGRLFTRRINGKPTIHSKMVDIGFSESEKNKFLRDFGPISDTIHIETLVGWSYSQLKDFMLGYSPATGIDSESKLQDRKICSIPFRTLSVNFNGEVSICCVDWAMQTIVGDVTKESLKDIWNGERLKEFRLTHLRGGRYSIPPCANCQHILGFSQEDDIDSLVRRQGCVSIK